MSAASCILALATLLPQGGGQDQAVELKAVERLDVSKPDSPVRFQRRTNDGAVVQVVWTVDGAAEARRFPLMKAVQDVDVAMCFDDSMLVVLAGGVRPEESLDLYLFSADGSIQPFEAIGDRRLPARFNGGKGSWPIVEPEAELVLLAFQREGNLEFLATDSAGRIHATRTFVPDEEALPGFRATWQKSTGQVQVEFGEPETLEFPHPLAPKLEVGEGQGLLDFGSRLVGRPASRSVELRNSGHMPLRLSLATSTDQFEVEGEPSREIEPGGRITVRVHYLALVEGAANDRLDITSNAASGRRSVSLRGEAITDSPASPAPSGERSAPSPDPPVTPAPAPLPPATPSPASVDVQSRGTTVRLRGWLEPPPPGTDEPVHLLVRVNDSEPVVAPLGGGRGFDVEVPARPGDELYIAVRGGGGRVSPQRSLVRVLPTLELVDGAIVIRGPPRAEYVLAAVRLDTEGKRIQRVLEYWTGRLGRMGVCTLTPGELGLGSERLDLVVLLPEHGELGLQSNRIQWPER